MLFRLFFHIFHENHQVIYIVKLDNRDNQMFHYYKQRIVTNPSELDIAKFGLHDKLLGEQASNCVVAVRLLRHVNHHIDIIYAFL